MAKLALSAYAIGKMVQSTQTGIEAMQQYLKHKQALNYLRMCGIPHNEEFLENCQH